MHKSILKWAPVWVFLSLLSAARASDDSKPIIVADYKAPIRLVCIGDSITHGGTLSYVSRLSTVLKEGWQITNLGESGATLLRNGDKPYNRLWQYRRALEIKPDVVTIALGTNDSKPNNWSHKGEFEADYKSMIADLKSANPKVRIYCCLPPPASGNKWWIDGGVIQNEIIPLVRKIAQDTDSSVINLYAALDEHRSCMGDGVHPNDEGHKYMAMAIYKALTGKDSPY